MIDDDDEIYDYCFTLSDNSLDMDEILDRVEKRINAPLPDNVRMMAKYTVESRQAEMDQVLDGSYIEMHNSNEVKGNGVLDKIKRNAEPAKPEALLGKIKTDSEQAEVGTADLTAFMRAIGLQMNFGKTDKEDDLVVDEEEK